MILRKFYGLSVCGKLNSLQIDSDSSSLFTRNPSPQKHSQRYSGTPLTPSLFRWGQRCRGGSHIPPTYPHTYPRMERIWGMFVLRWVLSCGSLAPLSPDPLQPTLLVVWAMDSGAVDSPVTLVIKAPNQKYEDQTINCFLNWTVEKLKSHISNVYPSKPVRCSHTLFPCFLALLVLSGFKFKKQFKLAHFIPKHTQKALSVFVSVFKMFKMKHWTHKTTIYLYLQWEWVDNLWVSAFHQSILRNMVPDENFADRKFKSHSIVAKINILFPFN